MACPDIDTALSWRGRDVHGHDGEKLGTLGDVFLDEDTSHPAWAGVKTGLFGHRETYVPFAHVHDDGDVLHVPFSEQVVKDAPRIDPDVALTREEEAALWTHYGLEYEQQAPSPTPAGEGEMIRSEEEVRARPGPMRPAERVRLRKVLVTDHETRTVPVRREVVQLETEPAPQGGVEAPVEPGDRPGERRL